MEMGVSLDYVMNSCMDKNKELYDTLLSEDNKQKNYTYAEKV